VRQVLAGRPPPRFQRRDATTRQELRRLLKRRPRWPEEASKEEVTQEEQSEGKQCLWVFEEESQFTSMRIDEHHPDMLLTEFGTWKFDISEGELEKLAAGTSSELPRREVLPTWSPVGIDEDGRWITWNGRKLIFLPVEFRPTDRSFSCLVQGLCVVIGCESGQVLLFRLSKDVSPDDPEQRWWGPPSGGSGL